jgi:hypothetical protein
MLKQACEILQALPDLGDALSAAEPELRRRVYEAFRLTVTLDKTAAKYR